MAETVIFAEQTLEFTEGIYEVIPAPFELVVGATYRVIWDGVEHECVCAEENGYSFLTDLQEDDGQIVAVSFDIFCGNADIVGVDGGAVAMAAYISGTFDLDTTTPTHTVAIYQAADDSTGGGVNVVVKDRNADPVEYTGISGVRLFNASGEAEEFVHASLIPTAEAKEVTQDELDFSTGAIVLEPEKGKQWSKVTIPVPDNLEQENISEGVKVAGIVGILAGGGAADAWLYANGSFKATQSVETITHGLGVVPDIIMVWSSTAITAMTSLLHAVSFSEAAIAALNTPYPCQVCSPNIAMNSKNPLSATISAKYGYAQNATENTFTVGGTTIKMETNVYYDWIAIGGIFA